MTKVDIFVLYAILGDSSQSFKIKYNVRVFLVDAFIKLGNLFIPIFLFVFKSQMGAGHVQCFFYLN